jgi:hypothetical protein
MSEQIWVSIITAIVAPTFLFFLQFIKSSKDKRLARIEGKLEETRMATIRLQILDLIHHDPKNKVAINNMMDIYTENGGNSYLLDVYKKWQKGKK